MIVQVKNVLSVALNTGETWAASVPNVVGTHTAPLSMVLIGFHSDHA